MSLSSNKSSIKDVERPTCLDAKTTPKQLTLLKCYHVLILERETAKLNLKILVLSIAKALNYNLQKEC